MSTIHEGTRDKGDTMKTQITQDITGEITNTLTDLWSDAAGYTVVVRLNKPIDGSRVWSFVGFGDEDEVVIHRCSDGENEITIDEYTADIMPLTEFAGTAYPTRDEMKIAAVSWLESQTAFG